MGVVQFRESEETLDFLRGLGLNPNQLSRELLQARVRRLRMEAALRELRGLRRDLGDAPALVRESRDER